MPTSLEDIRLQDNSARSKGKGEKSYRISGHISGCAGNLIVYLINYDLPTSLEDLHYRITLLGAKVRDIYVCYIYRISGRISGISRYLIVYLIY